MAHIPFLSHYLERKNIEYQNQLLARQVEEVQNIYLTMRGWRHDYHNHLQSMKAYVEMGQYDKLQEYLGTAGKRSRSSQPALRFGECQS
ncbi:MAG: Spo0B domain-containing protein [Blautia sp.]